MFSNPRLLFCLSSVVSSHHSYLIANHPVTLIISCFLGCSVDLLGEVSLQLWRLRVDWIYWIIECGFSLLVLCLVMLVFFFVLPQVQFLTHFCQVANHLFPFRLSSSVPYLPSSSSLWPSSQACVSYTSRRHADRQHKLQREHQVWACLTRPRSQHPLPSSIFYHAVLDHGRSHPDRTAAVSRLPAVPGAPNRPLACGQREQQRQLLWRQRSRWCWCSRRWRRRRWRRWRRWRRCYWKRQSCQPIHAARLQPFSRAPQGVERTGAGGREHQAHEIGRLGHIEATPLHSEVWWHSQHTHTHTHIHPYTPTAPTPLPCDTIMTHLPLSTFIQLSCITQTNEALPRKNKT